MADPRNPEEAISAARQLQKSLDHLNESITNEGHIRRKHFYITYILLIFVIAATASSLIAGSIARTTATDNKNNAVCVAHVLEKFIAENSDRNIFVNEVTQKALKLWKAQANFLTVTASPNLTETQYKKALSDYRSALASYLSIQSKQIRERQANPLPTASEVRACL
jgi:hypothetical protein